MRQLDSSDMNINLHIEHLILTGVDIQSHQKDKLGAAVTAELTRQIMDRGISFMFHSHSHN